MGELCTIRFESFHLLASSEYFKTIRTVNCLCWWIEFQGFVTIRTFYFITHLQTLSKILGANAGAIFQSTNLSTTMLSGPQTKAHPAPNVEIEQVMSVTQYDTTGASPR